MKPVSSTKQAPAGELVDRSGADIFARLTSESSSSPTLQTPAILLERSGNEIVQSTIMPESLTLTPQVDLALYTLDFSESDRGKFSETTSEISLDNPVVVCLPGMLIDGSEEDQLQLMLRFAASHIPGREATIIATPGDVPFGVAEVGGPAWETYSQCLQESPDRVVTRQSLDLVRAVIVPHMLDRDAKNAPIPMPIEELKRNFDSITFLSHCAGGVMAQEIANSIRLFGRQIGYNAEELDDALGHLTVLSIASVSAPSESGGMTGVYLQPTNDPIANPFIERFTSHGHIDKRDNVYLKQRDDSVEVVVAGEIPTTLTYQIKNRERLVDFAEATEHPEFAAHNLRLFRSLGVKSPNDFALRASRCLEGFVLREGKLSVEDLRSFTDLP